MFKFALVVLSGLFLATFLVDPAMALQHITLPPTPVPEPSFAERLGAIIGVSGATLAIIFVVVRQLAEVLAKVIPDAAAGPLGYLRKVSKLLAGYIPNRA